jgi:hypothetical protein
MVRAGRLFGLPMALLGKSFAGIDTRSAGKGGDFGKYALQRGPDRLRRDTRQEVLLGDEALASLAWRRRTRADFPAYFRGGRFPRLILRPSIAESTEHSLTSLK